MNDTELKPCPFCGERAETDFIPEHHSYQVECSDSMGCTARVTRDSDLGAIEAWNCRAPASANTLAPTDDQILALNAGEVHFSESPSKYPAAGFGTQYHAGAPGVLSFARAVLSKWGAPAPASQPVAPVGMPRLESYVVNQAAWEFVAAMPHSLPGPIWNDLKPALYAALQYFHDHVAAPSGPAREPLTDEQTPADQDHSAPRERCCTCKFWEQPSHQDDLHEDDREGACRRYPAVLIGSDVENLELACMEASQWAQPVMYAMDWCGEFKPSA